MTVRNTSHVTATAVAAMIAASAPARALAAAGGGPEQVLASDRLGEVMLGLMAVVAAIVATAWIGRRVLRLQPGMDSRLRLVGGLSLGPRERIVLVQAGDTQLLVGVAPGRVQTLHVLDQPLAVLADERTAAPAAPFARILERFQPARAEAEPAGQPPEPRAGRAADATQERPA